MLAVVAAREGAAGGWEIVLLQHTDRGMTRLADLSDLLAGYFDTPASALFEKAVCDPHQAVAADVEDLRLNPMLPSELVVSGLVYDVATGYLETVVAAGPLRNE